MLIGKAPDIRYSEITPRSLYLRRREFLRAAAAASAGTAAALSFPGVVGRADAQVVAPGKLAKIPAYGKSQFSTTEKPTSYDDLTTYNNFYEFGSDKSDPAINARRFR